MGDAVKEKSKLIAVYRTGWSAPDERVILYSLYKFAEACGNYKQFTLSRLLDHSIESDGVSPTQIFGLDRDTMEKILNGLTFNYPDLIEARFTLGLDNITLKSELSSSEILNELF
jgi:phosphoadenosine phosphosulfate reductase